MDNQAGFNLGIDHALVALVTILVWCMLPSKTGNDKEEHSDKKNKYRGKRPSIMEELRANYFIAAKAADDSEAESMCVWDMSLLSNEANEAIAKATEYASYYERSNMDLEMIDQNKILSTLNAPTQKAAIWGSAIEKSLGPLFDDATILSEFVIDEGESVYTTLHSMLSLVYYNRPEDDYGRWDTSNLDILELPL